MIRQAFREGLKAIIYCLPTGAGKTVSFADMALDAIKNGWPVMVLCNRTELIHQAADELRLLGLHPTIIDPNYRDSISMLYVASIQTLRNRRMPEIKMLIVDEAHERDFDPIVMQYIINGARVIAATATPIRGGKKYLNEDAPYFAQINERYKEYSGHLGDIYERIITPTTISELLDNEHLVPCVAYGPDIDLSDIKTTRGDFDESDLFKRFNKSELYANAIDNYIKYANDTKALVFNINVAHSKIMNDEFNKRGIASEHVDGKTKKEIRKRIFENLKNGITLIINNCDLATTGVNIRSLETILINRPTKSLPLYLQMLGRGSRPCPEINKAYFTFIDQGCHIPRLGFWEQEREYSLDKKFTSKSIGVGPTKRCDKCEAFIPASVVICPYCDNVHERAEKKLLEAEFVLLDKKIKANKTLAQMNVQELEEFRRTKNYALGWIVHQLMPKGREALIEYANMKGYQEAWVNMQFKIAEQKRIATKQEIFEFMKINKHVDSDFIKQYAAKKLRMTHNEKEIQFLIPKILNAYNDVQLGVIK